jgi:predicted deacylase
VAAKRLAGRLGPDAAANVALIRQALAEAIAEVTPRSELESLRRLLLLNAVDADYVFDMHSADDALMHIYFGAARWPDGADLSADTGSRATLLAADSGGDPFDEIFGNVWAKLRRELGDAHPIPDACMSATLEYRGHADVADELASADAAALIRFLQRRGLVAGDPGPLPATLCEATELAAADTPRAPAGGVVVYKAPLGATVAAGQIVAEILDPLAEEPARRRVPVRSRTDGLLYQRKRTRLVRPGQVICRIAGTRRLAEEGAILLEP